MIIINILILIKYCNSSLLLLLLLLVILIIIFSNSYVRRRMIPLLCLLLIKSLINILLGVLHYWNNVIIAFLYCCYHIKQEAIDSGYLKMPLIYLLQPYKDAVKEYSNILQRYLLGQETKPKFDSLYQCLKYLFANVRASLTYEYDPENESPHLISFISLIGLYRNPSHSFLFILVKMHEYNVTSITLNLVSNLITGIILCYLIYLIIRVIKSYDK